MKRQQDNPLSLKDFLLVTLVSGLFLSLGMFLTPLFPSETALLNMLQEVSKNGAVFAPYFDQQVLFQDVPLFYFLEWLSVNTFGESAFGLRFIPLIFSALGCGLLYIFGTLYYGRGAGFLSAIVLATSAGYYLFAHFASPDFLASLFMAGALCSFLQSTRMQKSTKRLIVIGAFGVFLSLAFLTKGPFALLIILAIILTWIVLKKRWWGFKFLGHPLVLSIFFCTSAPWFYLVQQHQGELFWSIFSLKMFGAYDFTEPFLPFTILSFLFLLPWVFFSVPAIKRRTNFYRDTVGLFLISWSALTFLTLIFADQLLSLSLALLLFPLSIMIGTYMTHVLKGFTVEGFQTAQHFTGVSYAIGAFLCGLFLWAYLNNGYTNIWFSDPTVWSVLGTITILILSGCYIYTAHQPPKVIGILLLSSACLLIVLNVQSQFVDWDFTKPLTHLVQIR